MILKLKRFWSAALLCGMVLAHAGGVFAAESRGNILTVKMPDSGSSDMIFVPAGEFLLGSTDKNIDWVMETFFSESREWYLDEMPSQKIYMDAFYIDRFEVTVAEYQKFIQQTNRKKPKFFNDKRFNHPQHPVVGVQWQDANDYCKWTGKRLPNEGEWEKAARGEDGRMYPWGDRPDPTKANVMGKKDSYRYTAPVGSFPEGKSPYGAHDMGGNVWEWVSGWYLPFPGNTHKNDMYGQTYKVIKGGSWNSNNDLARSAVRGKVLPEQELHYVGFRCAKSASPQ